MANSIAQGFLSVAAWNIAKIAASALTAPILARSLGSAGYGQYAAYLALIGVAWPLANLGMSHTLTRQIAQRPTDRAYQRRLIGFAAVVNLVGSALVVVGVLALLGPGGLAGGASPPVAGLIVGAIVGEQALLFAKGVLHGLRREDLVGLPAAIGHVASAALAILATFLGYGLTGVLAALCTMNLLSAAVALAHARRAVGWGEGKQAGEPLHRRSLLRFGMGSMLYTALAFVLYRADLLLLQQIAGPRQAGLYAAAVQWAEFVWFVPIAVQELVLQTITPLWATGRGAEVGALLSRLLRYVALATAFLLALVVALADPLIELYFGREFREASGVIRLLAPGVFSFSLARVMWPAIQAGGSSAAVPVIAAAVLLNLALNWLLIPRLGALGAAAACCVAYSGVAFAYARILRGQGVRPLAGVGVARVLLLALATAALVAPIASMTPTPLLALALGAPLAGLIYSAGALGLGLLDTQDVYQLRALIVQRTTRG